MRGQAIPRSMGRLPIVCALALLAWLPTASFAQTSERLIVKRVPGLSAAERADLRADVGANLVEDLRLPQTEVVTVPTHGAEDALAELNADPAVVYAEPDELRSALAPPDDPWWPYMWGLANTGQAPFARAPGRRWRSWTRASTSGTTTSRARSPPGGATSSRTQVRTT